jgi:hypothetical protein
MSSCDPSLTADQTEFVVDLELCLAKTPSDSNIGRYSLVLTVKSGPRFYSDDILARHQQLAGSFLSVDFLFQ